MKIAVVCATLCAGMIAVAGPAVAQRAPFERAFDVPRPVLLDVTTTQGKIEVVPGLAGRIVVAGTVTVRVGVNVPANAAELVDKVAKRPPVTQSGETIRVTLPVDAAE